MLGATVALSTLIMRPLRHKRVGLPGRGLIFGRYNFLSLYKNMECCLPFSPPKYQNQSVFFFFFFSPTHKGAWLKTWTLQVELLNG